MSAAPPPLITLLGAQWKLGAPVVAAGFAALAGRAHAGFALGDGTLAMVPAGWEGAPAVEQRPEGGALLVPGRDPPPLSRVAVHRGATLALAPDPAGGFLSGGDDGRFARVGDDGALALIGEFAGVWVRAVAAAGAWRACAAGSEVHLFGPSPERVALDAPVNVLAFDPSGRLLAIGHGGAVSLWRAGGGLSRWEAGGLVRALAWRADGRVLVAGRQEGPLVGWRDDGGAWRPLSFAPHGGPGHGLSVGPRTSLLAAAGGPRVALWDLAVPGGAALSAGLSARTAPVAAVAAHPGSGPVAAAYSNGAVLLCRGGSEEALFVRAAPAPVVRALAWSPDGDWLALGGEAGEAGMVSLPPALFRTPPATTQLERTSA